MKISSSLIVILTIIFSNAIQAQNIQDWAKEKELFPLVKLYLHVDRDRYFQKEDIWFKSYFLDGVTHKRMAGKENMFVDLIDENGKIVTSGLFLIIDGLSAGNITIPKDAKQGKYALRAYTDYQAKLGDDILFSKTIQVAEVKNTVGLDNHENEVAERVSFSEILFLPEGGFILAETNNTVAFKLLDNKGRGLEGKGNIVDKIGNVITSFSTNYKGMGKFVFMPRQDSSYFAEIDGHPDRKIKISGIRNKGHKIQLAHYNQNELVFELISNSEEENTKVLYLACMSRGNLLFYKTLNNIAKYSTFAIKESLLQNGINRFVLLNENFEPLSERLVFSDKKDVTQIKIKANLKEYDTRSLVELQLLNEEEFGENEFSNISIAVVDNNSLYNKDYKTNMSAWSLVDSELHYFTEPTNGYFQNDSLLKSKEKLDLLMLTHGWSSYIWNDTTKLKKEDRIFTSGIAIEGKGKQLLSNKPLSKSSVLVTVDTKTDDLLLTLDLDSNGKFAVENLFFTDTATVFIQTKDKKGKSVGEIILEPTYAEKPKISQQYLNNLSTFSDFPPGLYREKYVAEAEKREFYPDYETILMDDIDIIENKRKEKDEHPRIYGEPDHVLEVTESDATYFNILDFLDGRMPGVTVDMTDNTVKIRGNSGSPIFVIDGVTYSDPQTGIDLALSYSMEEVDKVEVLKSAGNLAMFGARGGAGVIAIYTKKGFRSVPKDRMIKGTITRSIIGFTPYRKFYAPQYPPGDEEKPEPDRRTTLYWNPDVNLNNTGESISFYTSDQQADYKIIVEGITNSGKVCLGFAELKVIK